MLTHHLPVVETDLSIQLITQPFVLLIKLPEVKVSAQLLSLLTSLQFLSSALELTYFSPASDPTAEKRPDTATASWPSGKSLRVIDLAITSPVSQSTPYSSSPTSIGPQRLLKKREPQIATEHSSLAQSQG